MATHPEGEFKFDHLEALQGYGDTSDMSGEIDDSLSLLGDEETLHAFMTREDELVQAYDNEDNPARKALIATQLSQLQNRYFGFRRQSVDIRHLVRIGSIVTPTPTSTR
jgi:hypothetical protein